MDLWVFKVYSSAHEMSSLWSSTISRGEELTFYTRILECPVCKKEFSSRYNMTRHINSIHANNYVQDEELDESNSVHDGETSVQSPAKESIDEEMSEEDEGITKEELRAWKWILRETNIDLTEDMLNNDATLSMIIENIRHVVNTITEHYTAFDNGVVNTAIENEIERLQDLKYKEVEVGKSAWYNRRFLIKSMLSALLNGEDDESEDDDEGDDDGGEDHNGEDDARDRKSVV
jgi:hypothetical protein